MALVSLSMPPGIVKGGTPLQATGYWSDGNLVRWRDAIMQPVYGWRARTTSAMTGVCRALLPWKDNSAVRRVGAGTHSKLYHISQTDTVSDITPVGFTAGAADAVQNLGFGGVTYGSGFWGIPREDQGVYTPATTWSLDAWGEYLLGCATSDGKIYEWQLNTAVVAAVLSNAPTSCTAMVVTEERIVFALGAGGVGNKISWSDQEANNTWTPAATNQAGDFTLQTAGNLIDGKRVRGQTLLLTDIDAHAATYAGPPYVYGFQKVGNGCGTVSANACAVADQFAVWMGLNSFFIYDGGAVRSLPSSVGDYVFHDMNLTQRSKVYAVVNSEYSEIWWLYPSQTTLECDKYVAWNYRDNFWMVGEVARTAGCDSGAFVYPLMTDSGGILYDHEVGFDYDSATVFCETAPIKIGQGDRMMVATNLIPDESTQGDVTAKFKTRFYPNGDETTHGPFTMTNPTSVRFQGRQVAFRVEGAVLGNWRVGNMRLNVVAGAGR